VDFSFMDKTSKDDKLFLKELGKRISEIRKDKGLSQVELGNICDIEKPNMNRIESGGTNPTSLTIRRICKGLEIELSELFKGLKS
jgi:transcriptional regulator with XRE-family HTH domain